MNGHSKTELRENNYNYLFLWKTLDSQYEVLTQRGIYNKDIHFRKDNKISAEFGVHENICLTSTL